MAFPILTGIIVAHLREEEEEEEEEERERERERERLRFITISFSKQQQRPISMIILKDCLLYTSPSPRDATLSRMPSSA